MQLLPNLDRTACTAHNALDTEDDAHERSDNRPCPARIWRGPLDRRRRFRNDGLAASDSATGLKYAFATIEREKADA